MAIPIQKHIQLLGVNVIKTICLLLVFSLCIAYLWGKDIERTNIYYGIIPIERSVK